MLDKISNFIKKIYRVGFIHIFSTSVVNKLLSLITNMVIIRILPKSEYGYFSYAYNIITIVLIFSDLGTRIARFQYCCETEDIAKRNAITRFLMRIGTTSNLIFGLVTFLYAMIVPLAIPGGRFYLQILSVFLIIQYYFDSTSYGLRIQKENKKFAYIANINSVCYLIFSSLGAVLAGVPGFVVGKYIAFIIPIIVGSIWYKKSCPTSNNTDPYILSPELKKEMMKYGLLIVLTNSVSSVLHYFDTFFVGKIVADEMILADYKVATVIPNALSFIPLSCITMIYPYFVKHRKDKKWILKNAFKIQILLAVPGLIISTVGVTFAPFIIRFVFGEEYMSAVPVFRILMLTFFVSSTFRIIYGNILSMLHLIKVNFIFSSVECVINIISDVIMIKTMGSIGAAYTTMFITILSSVVSGTYFYYYLNKGEKK